MKITEASKDELYELQCLIYRITYEIKTFTHVAKYLPSGIISKIEEFKEQVNEEYNERD